MSPYGGKLVEQSKFLPRDGGSQCNMDVGRQRHGSLICPAFATEPWFSHISGICDSGGLRERRIGAPERLGASGRDGHANSSDSVPPAEPDLRFRGILCLRESPMWPRVAPADPHVAPGELGERFSSYFAGRSEPGEAEGWFSVLPTSQVFPNGNRIFNMYITWTCG